MLRSALHTKVITTEKESFTLETVKIIFILENQRTSLEKTRLLGNNNFV